MAIPLQLMFYGNAKFLRLIMKNIFIVETPLQLLCAYELINTLGGKYCLILRFSEVGRNDSQMVFSAKKLNLKYRIILIRTHHAYSDFLFGIFRLIDVFFNKYEIIFLGSYFSKFIKMFGLLIWSNKKYLLDDGVATLLAQKRMSANGHIIDLATFFDIPLLASQSKIKHSFEAIRKKFTLSDPKGNYFIGQDLVEKDYLTLDKYIDLIKIIITQHKGTLFYYPHRAESDKTISAISKLSGVNLIYQEACIEIEFLSNKIYPKNIFTCISTAIITLSAIYPKANILTIIPKDFKTSDPHFHDILDYLKTLNNVRVFNLSDDKLP